MPVPWSGTRRVKCKGDSEPGFGERLLFVSCGDPSRTKDFLPPVRIFHDVPGFLQSVGFSVECGNFLQRVGSPVKGQATGLLS